MEDEDRGLQYRRIFLNTGTGRMDELEEPLETQENIRGAIINN